MVLFRNYGRGIEHTCIQDNLMMSPKAQHMAHHARSSWAKSTPLNSARASGLGYMCPIRPTFWVGSTQVSVLEEINIIQTCVHILAIFWIIFELFCILIEGELGFYLIRN